MSRESVCIWGVWVSKGSVSGSGGVCPGIVYLGGVGVQGVCLGVGVGVCVQGECVSGGGCGCSRGVCLGVEVCVQE